MNRLERDAKEYLWKWVTADELLSRGGCELCYARLFSDTDAGSCILYDGEDAQGRVICVLRTSGMFNTVFNPPNPIYCRRGLFLGTLTTADVFVQWRPRASQEG